MNTPLISIITCTYNSSKYLEKNILSVEKQNYNNFEHIFIDGFSNDGTVEIIEQYRQKYPNQVKLFQFKPEGISKAMNQGIGKSSGKYLIHLHSDDSFVDGEVLEDVSSFLNKNNQPDWIYGKINVMKDGKILGNFPTKNIWHKKNNSFFINYLLKFNNYIPHQAVFIKKNVFNKFSTFDENLTSSMDYDLWLRIRLDTNWLYFDRTISNYSIRKDAQSSGLKNIEENKNNQKIVLKDHLNWIEINIAKLINLILKNEKSRY